MPKRTKPLNEKQEATAGGPVTHAFEALADGTVRRVTSTEKPTRTRKQGELPGMESPKHPELDTLLELYAEKVEALSSARVAVGELKGQIIQTATKLGVSTYRNDTASPPLVLTLTERDLAVKVQAVLSDVDESEADDAD